MAKVDTGGASAAGVDNNNVLTEWVRQPTANAPSESSGQILFSEKWLAPYKEAIDILSKVGNGDSPSTVHSKFTAHKYSAFDIPTCPTRNNIAGTWTLYATNVEDKVAGNHCYVTFTFQATFGNDVSNLTEDPYGDVWSLTWQSYTVNPYAFLKGDAVTDESAPERPPSTKPTQDWAATGYRRNIETCLKQLGAAQWQIEDGAGDIMYAYRTSSTERKFAYLNGAETEVMKKVLLGKSCVYHFPVLVHQTVHRGKFSQSLTFPDTLGEDLDVYSSSTPTDCPYTFNSDEGSGQVYKWIKVGDDMEQSATKTSTTFTRKETWWGIVEPDENFYGSGTFSHTKGGIQDGRWKIGNL